MTHIRTIPVSTIHIPFPRHPKGFNPETSGMFPISSFFFFSFLPLCFWLVELHFSQRMRSPKLPPLFAWIGSNRLHRPNSYPIPRSGRISILTFSFLIRLLFDQLQLQLQLQLQPSAFLFCLTHFFKKNRASASGGVRPLHRKWVCISFVLKSLWGLIAPF